MSTLYIVATPIGNLEDLSRRAERVLREVDLIVCEDTRVTGKLLQHFDVPKKSLLSYHAQSPESRIKEILNRLREGSDVAVVSDAGTPGINDPGGKLVRAVATKLAEVKIVPIPGPSTVATTLSVSGFPAERFHYFGFPPHKKSREKFFREITTLPETVVFLESPYRILKAMNSLAILCPNRSIVVARELTKHFETIYRGTVAEVTGQLKSGIIKGEFVVILGPTHLKS